MYERCNLLCIELRIICTVDTMTKLFFCEVLTEFQTPNGVPPFDKIRLEHYEPAFLQGIEEQNSQYPGYCRQYRSAGF